jgi:predicted  nucleic acid-binding Zn-ribbon protein
MKEDKRNNQAIFELQGKIEKAENNSSGNIEDESRLDDLHCELLALEEMLA